MRHLIGLTILGACVFYSGLAIADETTDAAPPCACVIFPIEAYVDGYLFYCDYYASNCNDTPEAAYAIENANTPWPYQNCGDASCFAAFRADTKKKPRKGSAFPGLPGTVPSNYLHDDMIPAGKARELTQILIDPKLEYLKCKIDNMKINAKVLVFVWQTGAATGDPKNKEVKVRYIAFHTDEIPSGATSANVICTPVNTGETPCYAYKCVYQPTGAKAIPILVFVSNK